MEARVEENKKCWENKKCCWSTSRRRVIPQLFRVLPNFHECFYNSIETKRTQFFLCGENFIMLLILNLPNFLMSSFTGLIIVYFFFHLTGICCQSRGISKLVHSRIMGRFLVGLHLVHHIRVRKLLDGPEVSGKKDSNCPMDELMKKGN